MCQADDGAKCGDGVAPKGALQLGSSGEAEEAIRADERAYWALRCDEWASSFRSPIGPGRAHPEECRQLIAHQCEWIAAELRDPTLPRKAANSQSPDEEPQRGDEVDAASASASLTPQKIENTDVEKSHP